MGVRTSRSGSSRIVWMHSVRVQDDVDCGVKYLVGLGWVTRIGLWGHSMGASTCLMYAMLRSAPLPLLRSAPLPSPPLPSPPSLPPSAPPSLLCVCMCVCVLIWDGQQIVMAYTGMQRG